MEIVLLAVIGLVLLLGVVALAVGNKGWSWGTVAAGVLLLFAATGYLYLATRLAERERSWRTEVTKTQSEIDRIVGDGKPGAAATPKSVAALRHERDRWTRALAFVDTWHGRRWRNATLSPPRNGNPGTISIEMPSEESESGSLPAGAEVAVFDDAGVEEDGRFLGLFRVQSVNAVKGAETCQLSIVPASLPVPPDEADVARWNRDYDAVTVYESLPVDRWLAFHKTQTAGDDDKGGSDRWMPKPRKTSGEEALEHLEEHMTSLARHDDEVPQAEWPQLKTETLDGKSRTYLVAPNGTEEIHPGRYWAVVEFTKNVRFKKNAGQPGAGEFVLDESAGDEPAGEGDDEGPLEAGAMIEPGDEPEEEGAAVTKVPRDADPTAGAVTRRFRQKRFREGEQAEFDLQTALELQDDKEVRIARVLERRPLADPATALRGTEFGAKAADGGPLRAEGFDAVRQALLVKIESITATMTRIERSRTSVESQARAVAEQTKQLADDLAAWGEDAAAAGTMADAFDARLRQATLELAATENSIVRLGDLLRGDWGKLTDAVDAAAAR